MGTQRAGCLTQLGARRGRRLGDRASAGGRDGNLIATMARSLRQASWVARGLIALGLVGCALAAVAAPANMGFVGGKTSGGTEFSTTAPYVILMDAASGTILFEKSGDTPTPPSSMAK